MVRVMIITFTILNFSSFILFLVDPMPPNYDHVGWHIVIPMFTSIVWIINPFIYVFTCDYIRAAFYETIHEFGCFKKKKITITNEADNESQNEECIELEETNRISTK